MARVLRSGVASRPVGHRELSGRAPLGAVGQAGVEVVSPCLLHEAAQPVGVTCTTMRRAHSAQKRGGSMTPRRDAQAAWSVSSAGFPQ
ncbi:hypothetical protein [Saccharothrix xinjiangensis]|uniref:Uncharacterized protein n=1 Tax=Saccharothrix xinjiangensis TaxID=204798 RepID=A0ABV9XSQ8_9PSEU